MQRNNNNKSIQAFELISSRHLDRFQLKVDFNWKTICIWRMLKR